jgi:hypothetical protein
MYVIIIFLRNAEESYFLNILTSVPIFQNAYSKFDYEYSSDQNVTLLSGDSCLRLYIIVTFFCCWCERSV